MSNHSGSYLLNEVIELLGKETSQRLVLEIIRLATTNYGCNTGEILEGHDALFNLCDHCFSSSDNLKNGLCPECCKRFERKT